MAHQKENIEAVHVRTHLHSHILLMKYNPILLLIVHAHMPCSAWSGLLYSACYHVECAVCTSCFVVHIWLELHTPASPPQHNGCYIAATVWHNFALCACSTQVHVQNHFDRYFKLEGRTAPSVQKYFQLAAVCWHVACCCHSRTYERASSLSQATALRAKQIDA
jgi:hypothetical protein